MGEFEFIEAIRRAFEGIGEGGNGHGDLAGTDPQDSLSRSVTTDNRGFVGIGDDCAVIPIGGGEAFVVTTDMLVDGVHFLREATSARELGAKALAVNLSDVAAMGARPVVSLLSIALPQDCHGSGNAHGGFSRKAISKSADWSDEFSSGSWIAEFMEGYREMSVRHGVRLAGGDTTGSIGGVAINVTAIGRAPLDRLKYRSGARVGDIIVVGGTLGESATGLRDILAGRFDTPLAHIHRNPTPQVEEGEWLGDRAEVHSMIDLSDGLASDLVHILRASGVGAGIDLDAIPISVTQQMCAFHENSIELAVTGGEDYKLLFTVAPEAFARLAEDYRARFGTPLHPVGHITADPPEIRWLENGAPVSKNWRGFTHFCPTRKGRRGACR